MIKEFSRGIKAPKPKEDNKTNSETLNNNGTNLNNRSNLNNGYAIK